MYIKCVLAIANIIQCSYKIYYAHCNLSFGDRYVVFNNNYIISNNLCQKSSRSTSYYYNYCVRGGSKTGLVKMLFTFWKMKNFLMLQKKFKITKMMEKFIYEVVKQSGIKELEDLGLKSEVDRLRF